MVWTGKTVGKWLLGLRVVDAGQMRDHLSPRFVALDRLHRFWLCVVRIEFLVDFVERRKTRLA